MQTKMNHTQKQETTSVVFLLIVIMVIIRPITPFLTDSIAHRFFAVQHEQLHQLGVDHIDDDIKAANEQTQTGNKLVSSLEPVLIFCEQIAIPLGIPNYNTIFFKEPTDMLLSAIHIPTIHPPDGYLTVCPSMDVLNTFHV